MRKSRTRHSSATKFENNLNKQFKIIANNYMAVVNIIEENAPEALKEIGQDLLQESLRLAPKDEGDLVDSAYLSEAKDGNNYVVEVGYKTDYAAFVHEMPKTRKDYVNPTTPGTHWQYLLSPAVKIESELLAKVAAKLEKELK